MPAAQTQMPLHHHPSYQAMRQVDGLRQHGSQDPQLQNGQGPKIKTNGAYQKIFPPSIHDFQEFPSRRPTTANAITAQRRYDAPSPMPNFHAPRVDSEEPTRLAFLDKGTYNRLTSYQQWAKWSRSLWSCSTPGALPLQECISCFQNVFQRDLRDASYILRAVTITSTIGDRGSGSHGTIGRGPCWLVRPRCTP